MYKHILLTLLPQLSSKNENKIKGLISWMLEKHISYSLEMTDWLEIPSKTLKSKLGRDYSKVINEAIEKGIIEKIDYYSKTLNQCKKYRISWSLIKKTFMTKTNNKIVVKIVGGENEYNQKDLYLRDCLANIDLIKNYKESVEIKTEKYIKEKYADQHALKVYNKIYLTKKYNLLLLYRIKDKDIYLYRDNFSGRLHTNITSLPKYLIPTLRVSNFPLVSIDISNCHLVMLHMLLSNRAILNTITNIQYPYQPPSKLPPPIPSIMWRNAETSIDKTELNRFYTTLDSQTLYENFSKYFENGEKSAKPVKSKMKKLIMTALNQRWDIPHEGTLYLQKEFPSIMKFLKELRKDNHKIVAYLCQRAEVYLMYDVVIPYILDHHSNVWMTTKHDCILTTPDSISAIEDGYKYARELLEIPLRWKIE